MHWWTWVFGGAGVGVPIAIVTTWLTLRKRSHETPPHLKLKQRAHGGIVAGRDIHVGGDLNFVDLSDSDVARIADTLADPLQQRQKNRPGTPPAFFIDKRALARGINNLPETVKIVVTLRYHEGLELAEIAQVLGITEEEAGGIHESALVKLADTARGSDSLTVHKDRDED